MPNFDLSTYLVSTCPDIQRSAVDTVLEYVTAYQKWASDCHNWAKENRDQVAELQQGEAREALKQIQKKYCAAKNRQHWRTSSGYYFYGGTYDVYPAIQTQEPTGSRSYSVITEKRKPGSPSFRFTLAKRHKIWLIVSLERLDGTKQWVPDTL